MRTQKKIKVGSVVCSRIHWTAAKEGELGIVLFSHPGRGGHLAWNIYWFKDKQIDWEYEKELELVV